MHSSDYALHPDLRQRSCADGYAIAEQVFVRYVHGEQQHRQQQRASRSPSGIDATIAAMM